MTIFLVSQGQETIVKGKVTDANTNEGVPFANVFFKGTTIGTTTDFEGYYTIKTTQYVDSLTVSFIGYETKSKFVKKGVSQIIDFQLKPTSFQMNEVVVRPGENPAHKILRKVWASKDKHNKESLDAYDYESYTKIEVAINNISEEFKNRKIMRPFKVIFDSLQVAAGEDGQMVLPAFASENLSRYYYLKNPERKKEYILGSKVNGVGIDDGTFVSQFVGASFQQYNFYDNWLNILDKNFVSPIADGGLGFYKYYLEDTVILEGRTCYEIRFEPKRVEDLAFHGKMWIDDSTYALKSITVEIGKKANLNFVERLKIQQDMAPLDSSEVWMPSKTRVLIDIAELTDKTFGMLGKFYVSNNDFVINKPKQLKFYDNDIERAPDYLDHEDNFWDENRHEKLSNIDKSIYKAIDSINNFPKLKTYIDIAEVIVQGYYEAGKIDIGPYILLYGNNIVEGNRFRFGFKTNEDFSKYWIIRGYLAYGTKDKVFKYNGQIERFISRKSWTKIGIQHRFDLVGLGVYDDFFATSTLFAASSQIGLVDRFNSLRLNRFWFESDLFKGFSQRIFLVTKDFRPKGRYVFSYYKDLNDEGPKEDDFQVTEVSLESRYAPKETYIIDDNDRFSLGTGKAPALTLRYTLGLKGILNGDFEYHKISLGIEQNIKMGPLGEGFYSVTGSKIFSKLPYPLLNILPGNETFIRSSSTYNLMNFFEFVTDETLEASYSQHFDGFLLNRIPLMKKLKWRMVAGAKAAWGNFSYRNSEIIPEENNMGEQVTKFRTLTNTMPYVEVSYGIENILKFIRIDAIHRLTYLDNPGAKKFGVKGSLYFSF